MKMILIKQKIYMIVILLLALTSCSDDFLNIAPRDRFSDELVWQDPILAEKFVSDIYNVFEVSNSGFTEQMQASATDESIWNHTDAFLLLNTGNINGVNQGWRSEERRVG